MMDIEEFCNAGKYMIEIEEFCNGYYPENLWFEEYYDVKQIPQFTIKEVSENAGKYFGASMAKDYAVAYLTKTLGEI